MKKTYEFVAVNGRAAVSVSVTVYNYGTVNLATLYSDSAGTLPLANPVVTDVNGYYEFYAADGRYSLAYSGTAITPRTLTDLIIDDTLNPVSADAARVGANDGSSGSLWTTVQGFINKILSSAGASVVGFIQSGTGAVATTVAQVLSERISVFRFMTAAQIADVEAGTALLDVSAAIQAGIIVTAAVGAELDFPPGTYLLTLSSSITLEGGATVCALKAKTGMKLRGSGMTSTILKLKSGESSNASPKYFNIIASNEVLDGIVIDGICFDINGSNNLINANNGFNCCAFIISGSVATVGVDARVTNMKFTNNMVKNSPGNSCLGLGQSNSVGSTLGRNIEIAHNRFYNNGLDTNDHSTIYAWADSVDIHGNLFDHPAMSSGTNGPRYACELHGSRNNFHDNEVYNYFAGVYIAGNLTSVSNQQSVSNNDFVVSTYAAISFIETPGEPGCAFITVDGNRIWITDDNHSSSKTAIGINPSRGTFNTVNVTNNIIYSSDDNICIGVSVYSLAIAGISKIKVSNNNIQGVTQGIKLGVSGGQVVDNVDISSNLINVTTTTGTPTLAFGIYLPGPLGTASIENNKFSGTANTFIYADSTLTATTLLINGNSGAGTFTNGINLTTNSNVTNLTMDNNDFVLAATNIIIDQFTVSGRRTGRQARTFAGLPAQSSWYIGDVTYVASVANAAGVITGYHRLTNGTGNVLNTDWRGFGVTV